MHALDADLATRMARLAIENVGREYPNAPAHLLRSHADLLPPRRLHPAFFGSYDWHSSVHQHWLLVRLLRLGLLPEADAAGALAALGASLTRANVEVEAAYLRERPSFERTYGWAWLLRLAQEIADWPEAETGCAAALAPAVDAVRANWLAYLPRAAYAIRAGTHANSAFGLVFALDYARGAGDEGFAAALIDRATTWFAADSDYPAQLEPGGDDFLSGALVEAVLMSRLLEPDAFTAWFEGFLPSPPDAILEPAAVTDRSDPKTVHLDGLNLSRAWCWREIGRAGATPGIANDAAARHLDAAMPQLFSGEYVGEHWVSSFAALALTTAPL